ncbi:MAG: NAD(P)-dependent oxidoreductase [Alphaproteobacteria bacterium]|nr:NAD(P)-dependent oxidoreductase [Alphaproteobacteria bacterium]
MKVGFIGLGVMGGGMAKNLVAGGHQVTVYNRTRAKAEALAGAGAMVVDTPLAAATEAEVLITVLGGDASVAEILFEGDDDLIAALPDGAIHVSMETISVAYSETLTETHKARGKGFICAPIIGRGDAAEAGELTLIVGGAKADVDRCAPVFEPMSKRAVHVGEDPKAAAIVKLSNNYLIAGALGAMGEAFAVVLKAGVDPQVFYDLITATMFSAPIYTYYGKNIATDIHAPPNFRTPLGLKDITQMIDSAAEIGVPMPLGELLQDQLRQTIEAGDEDLDWSSMARVAARAAGL